MDCPAAPQNVAKEIVTDTQGSVSGLSRLVGGELKNRVEVTAKNLFEKYPQRRQNYGRDIDDERLLPTDRQELTAFGQGEA